MGFVDSISEYWLAEMTRLGKVFSVNTTRIAIAGTAEANFLYLLNPVASGKKLYVYRGSYGVEGDTGVSRIYVQPTVTANGTALTAVNHLRAAAAPAAVGAAYRLPTTTGLGALLRYGIMSDPGVVIQHPLPETVILEEGYSILMTALNGKSNSLSFADFSWVEI